MCSGKLTCDSCGTTLGVWTSGPDTGHEVWVIQYLPGMEFDASTSFKDVPFE